MSLLTIVQDAMVLAGLPRPTNVAASADPGVITMMGIVNQAGLQLMRRHAWQALTEEKTFTTVAATEQADAIPADFDRFVNETMFNRTRNRPLYGPVGNREWQRRQASAIVGIGDHFRVRGNAMLLSRAPSAGETIAFEFVSKNWVTSDKVRMTSDTDEALLDENLITVDAVWRYLKVKGLDYAEDFRTAEEQILQAIARDGGRGTQSFNGGGVDRTPQAPILNDGQLITHAS